MPILIGAHVSAAGGLHNAIENGERIGARAIQMFGSSPRQWHVSRPDEKEAGQFKAAHAKSRIKQVFLHAPYLVNMASAHEPTRKRSTSALAGHLHLAQEVGAEGVIFHVGSAGVDNDRADALARVAVSMKEVLARVKGKGFLILENGSGGGGKLGTTASELGALIKSVASPRVKLCFDTAHAYGGGVVEFTPQGITDFFDTLDTEGGAGRLIAIHANDSKGEFGSHLDRHENIGEGHIGINGFRTLAADKRAASVPWILEVPGFSGEGPDQKNIELLTDATA